MTKWRRKLTVGAAVAAVALTGGAVAVNAQADEAPEPQAGKYAAVAKFKGGWAGFTKKGGYLKVGDTAADGYGMEGAVLLNHDDLSLEVSGKGKTNTRQVKVPSGKHKVIVTVCYQDSPKCSKKVAGYAYG